MPAQSAGNRFVHIIFRIIPALVIANAIFNFLVKEFERFFLIEWLHPHN